MPDNNPLLELETAADEKQDFIRAPGHPVILDASSRHPLVIIDGQTVRLWARLDEDLDIVPLSDFGRLGEFEHEVWLFAQDCGIGGLFEPATWGFVWVGSYTFGYERAQWAMCEGLMPHQPFQVELYARHFMHETREGAEGDCETCCEIATTRNWRPGRPPSAAMRKPGAASPGRWGSNCRNWDQSTSKNCRVTGTGVKRPS